MDKLKKEQILALVKKFGIIRPRDLLARGFAKEQLRRLYQEGHLDRPARGLYTLPNKDFGTHEYLVRTCKYIPNGVICLLSALRFHEITTQSPFEIWVAIPNKARARNIKELPLRFVRFSGRAFDDGIEAHGHNGTLIQVYCVAKTVADCFKYRNKIGIDVAIEALQECWRKKKTTIDELWHYATICRVSRVTKPYLEMLT